MNISDHRQAIRVPPNCLHAPNCLHTICVHPLLPFTRFCDHMLFALARYLCSLAIRVHSPFAFTLYLPLRSFYLSALCSLFTIARLMLQLHSITPIYRCPPQPAKQQTAQSRLLGAMYKSRYNELQRMIERTSAGGSSSPVPPPLTRMSTPLPITHPLSPETRPILHTNSWRRDDLTAVYDKTTTRPPNVAAKPLQGPPKLGAMSVPVGPARWGGRPRPERHPDGTVTPPAAAVASPAPLLPPQLVRHSA